MKWWAAYRFRVQEEPFDELGAELRHRVGEELRREAEDLEWDAERLRLRARSLTDVAHESMSRGDVVAIKTRLRSPTGRLVAVAGTLAILATQSGEVDVNLAGPVALRVMHRATHGGAATRGGSPSFRARLAEYELSGEELEVVAPELDEVVTGRIDVVGADHVVVVDRQDRSWALPLHTIALVSRSHRP